MRDAGPLSAAPPVTTFLVADSGSAARVRLRRPAEPRGDGLWTMDLEVTDVARAGTYAGVLRLDPAAADSPKLKATVHVQDFILWPLLVLVAGALLGGLGRRYVELLRERNRVRTTLASAVRSYRRAAAGAPASLPPLAGAEIEAERIDDALRHADAASEVRRAADAATALVQRLARWVQLRNALTGLQAAVEGVPADPEIEASDAIQDAEALLGDRTPDAEDADAVAQHVQLLADQRAIVRLIGETWREHVRLRAVLGTGEDHPEARAALRHQDPRTIYTQTPGPGSRDEADVARLLRRLATAARTLRWHAAEARTIFLSATEEDAAGAPGPAAEPFRVPDPASLEAEVRTWDYALFAVSVVVVALAYLIPLYIGKAYGSWDDYLTAFAAGFAGTLVIPWDRLPLFAETLRAPKADVAKIA